MDLSQDRHRSPRLRDGGSVGLTDPSHPADWWKAAVIDRSPQGMALRVNRSVEVGSILLIEPAPESRKDNWLPVVVRYARREGSGLVIGVELQCHPVAARLRYREGLTKIEAEEFLDWLQQHDCRILEVSANRTGYVVYYSG